MLVIGIGAGDPDLITVHAVAALNEVDVFIVIDKGDAKDDLVAVRRDVLQRFAGQRSHRLIEISDPVRDAALGYADAVALWHLARLALIERTLLDDVGAEETVGLLVWGDPSLYDSTLRIIDQLNTRGAIAVDHTVFPGISSVQLLTARHRIALNRIGHSVHITTGRLLRDGLPDGVEDVVVMLDGETSFTKMVGRGYEIFWGAFLGSVDEVLIAGPLDDVADEIVRVRGRERRRKGWMFDTYLLRRLAPLN